ncbi:MAG: DUF4493 domain-containing protein [Odoribacter sp.]
MRSIYLTIIWMSLLACWSCREETDTCQQGQIRLTLTDRVASKSLPDELSPALTNLFTVQMEDSITNRLVFKGTCADFNAKPQLFRGGKYAIEAHYGEDLPLAMDAPYYASEVKHITVKAGKEQTVTLLCTVGNALASFELTNQDKLEKVLKNYYIEVVASGQSLKWTPGSTAHPYFKAGSKVVLYLKGTWIENNQPYRREFANIFPAEKGKRYNYRLKFDTSNITGAILDIQVDASVETVAVNETLPPAWLPKPKITADGFDESHSLTYTETGDAKTAVLRYAAVRPVEEVELTLNFTDPKLSPLNKTYRFSTMTAEEKAALTKANIILPSLDGVATSGVINLTAMTSQLWTKEGGLTADNQIRLRVKANDRWSEETAYTIKTIKPFFRIGVLPGNIWTKEFTATSLSADSVKTGNFTRFTDISYEFSPDGNQWTALTADLRKEGLTPGTTYYVRPKYRGTVPGEASEVKTYEALSVPNANLDGGYDQEFPMKKNPLYIFKGGWIDTRNSLTCHSKGTNAFYVSKSGTLPETDNGSTVAHLMTIGWGQGNTCNVGKKAGSLIKNISAGIVCVGDYREDQDSVYAKAAFIRPTRLSFVYKASPYNGDSYLVTAYLVNITNQVETVIGKARLESNAVQQNYTTKELNFNYDDQYARLPITHLRIVFKGGTLEDVDHLEDKFRDASVWDGYANAYIVGSQFWLDTFSLHYDK